MWVGSTPAKADQIVTFTLSNVTFTLVGSPAGSASGSFVYDVTTNSVTSVNITTTAAAPFPGSSYTNPALTQVFTIGRIMTGFDFEDTFSVFDVLNFHIYAVTDLASMTGTGG